ncbi:MAG: hypothetical protein WBB23_23620 [Desulforhopalus sp.]
MWKSLTSSIILVVAFFLMTTLQACTKYHDNGNLDNSGVKSERYDPTIGPYGGPYSGKGPGGMGVK